MILDRELCRKWLRPAHTCPYTQYRRGNTITAQISILTSHISKGSKDLEKFTCEL